MLRRLVIVTFVLVGCGTVRTPFSSGPEEHAGDINCHGVLLPSKGSPKPMFLCAGSRSACDASRSEHIAKKYAVSDCTSHPRAACMPSDDGQICLGSISECRDFAKSASRDPDSCTPYDSDVGVRPGAFAGMFEFVHGDAAVMRTGDNAEVRYASGVMQCAIAGTTATCAWSEGDKKGRAKLVQQTDGSWSGSYGDGESDASGGSWTFRRKR